eukprot:GHVQ01029760.1.p2 GENE.GHVQ01029760.1~~GHVQ01029760.1.p2  ORF type:complete len:110 (+),score=15.82 GHVQ01029760.1:433-762(+)
MSLYPDSPYHRYAYETEPFSNGYSTHSRHEEYGSEFNNRYYHNKKLATSSSYDTYKQRQRDRETAAKPWDSVRKVGVLDSGDAAVDGVGLLNRLGATSTSVRASRRAPR